MLNRNKFFFNEKVLIILLLLNAGMVEAQESESNLIVVQLIDTTNIYSKVRQAITFTDLMIREDSRKDTLITYSERIHDKTIFIIAKIVIDKTQVKISGAYGLGVEDFWGYPDWPKTYKRVVYFKGSEAWLILRRIAIKLDGKIVYKKE